MLWKSLWPEKGECECERVCFGERVWEVFPVPQQGLTLEVEQAATQISVRHSSLPACGVGKRAQGTRRKRVP